MAKMTNTLRAARRRVCVVAAQGASRPNCIWHHDGAAAFAVDGPGVWTAKGASVFYLTVFEGKDVEPLWAREYTDAAARNADIRAFIAAHESA